MTTDHAATVRHKISAPGEVSIDSALAALDALVAERDEALRLRDKSDEAHHREYTGRMAAEADRDTLAAALRDIVMAEPDEPQPGSATAWPSFAGRLQNIAGAALARLERNQE